MSELAEGGETSPNCGIHSRIVRIVLIVTVAVFFLVTAIVNALAGGSGKSIGLFYNSTGEISDFYHVELTPSGWAFSIWGIIYFMQIAMIIYFFVNIFRKNGSGNYLCCDPNYISVIFLCIYGLSYFFNVAWIFTFDRSIKNAKLLSVSAFLLWMILITLIVSLIFHYIDFRREASKLMSKNLRVDVWLTIILVQNGISLYTTWCAVASPLNSGIGFAYVQNINITDSSTIALSILAFEIVVYVSLDTFVLDRWTRFTITPHCVLVWALTGSITKNYKPGKRNSIFTAVLLALAVFALVEKIILIIVRQRKYPRYTRITNEHERMVDQEDSEVPNYDSYDNQNA